MTLLLIHAAATLFLTGLIWFVQVVHYPLMGAVDPARFPAFETAHVTRTGRVVTPAMVVELVAAVLLVARRGDAAALLALALLVVVWLSTALLQVPCHRRLAEGFDPAVHRRLVRTNWVRTAGWSARGVIALAFLA